MDADVEKPSDPVLSPAESVERQFKLFLEGIRMDKYFENFKDNEVCDMDCFEDFDSAATNTQFFLVNLFEYLPH